MSFSEPFAKYHDTRYRDIERPKFIKFLGLLGFFEVAKGDLEDYFSDGYISSVQVSKESTITTMYIVRLQEVLETLGMSEEKFLEKLEKCR